MATGAFTPNGSYQQTVTNIQVTLQCNAQKLNQQWVPAQLDLTSLGQVGIENIDGTLRATTQPAPAKGFIPGGSYLQTCNGITVLLVCQARKINQTYTRAALDLTTMQRTADVANMDGCLLDMAAVDQAHAQVAQMFPQAQAALQANKDAIDRYAMTGVQPSAPPPSTSIVAAPAAPATVGDFTPCETAIGLFIFDCIFFALSLMGIKVSNSERIARSLMRELGQDTINGLAATMHNFRNATDAFSKAKYLFAILSGSLNISMLKAVLAQMADQMSFWDWAKTSVIATAQLTAWFATDGVAFIAEAVIVIMGAVTLAQSADNAVTVCSAA